jgi:hypothetical protein
LGLNSSVLIQDNFSQAGAAGWIEILVIALLLLWIYNSYRRSQVLKRMEEQLGRKSDTAVENTAQRKNKVENKKGDYVDYEIID